LQGSRKSEYFEGNRKKEKIFLFYVTWKKFSKKRFSEEGEREVVVILKRGRFEN